MMIRLLSSSAAAGWKRRGLPHARRFLTTLSSRGSHHHCVALGNSALVHCPANNIITTTRQPSSSRRWLGISRHAHKEFDPEPPEAPEPEIETKMFTADDMEFFDELNDQVSEVQEEEDLLFQRQEQEEEERERQFIRDALDARTGRGWTDPWEITDEDWASRDTYEDLPDWTPEVCSRVSLERVRIHPDGIPSLSTLAHDLPLPPPPPPHPGHGDAKSYARHRESQQYQYIRQQVVQLAEPQVKAIRSLPHWQDKQDAVDELFESTERQLQQAEIILGKHPKFGEWVERALESYLKTISTVSSVLEESKEEKEEINNNNNSSNDDKDSTAAAGNNQNDDDDGNQEKDDTTTTTTTISDERSVTPVFMDLFDDKDDGGAMVPSILHPLAPHPRDGPGRMMEEWELSAHRETKRIMVRKCMRDMARILLRDSDDDNKDDDSSAAQHVVVTGRAGVGKTAALAALVASARKSNYLVLYLPDGDRLRKNGKYIEPSARRKGMFDLPVLSQEVCGQFLKSHEADLEGLMVSMDTLHQHFTEEQLKRLPIEDGSEVNEISMVELLRWGEEHTAWAPMCYSAVVHTLMNQSEKPFLMVLDEFNCYYDHGYYFHMEYDETVRKAIPCHLISLFQPALDALGLSTSSPEESNEPAPSEPALSIQRGGILVGMTESHAVARCFTDALVRSARSNPRVHVVEVPRYSALETEHILANMEATGVGRLRFDRGDTVMNEQEVAYVRMVSGGAGQALLDECVV